MKKLVADIDIPHLKGVFEPFFNEVVYKKGSEIIPADLSDAEALIIRTRTLCDINLLSGSDLKVIGTTTIGTDHIDLNYCSENGIKVISAPGCNAGAVSQWVLSSLFLVNSSMGDFKGKVLGVVGAGNIGKLVIEVGKSLGMHVLINDPPRERAEGVSIFTDISTIFRDSDIVTFHVPLSFEGPYKTFDLADEKLLKLLKRGAVIINSSRGGIINEKHLYQTISKQDLRAVLDVWLNEPDISTDLLNKSVIATPHIAGYSVEGKQNATIKVVNELSNFFELGLRDWKPVLNLDEQRIEIDIDNYLLNNDIDLIKLINRVYNIDSDSKNLKTYPKRFEELRNGYELRRENSAYVLKNVRTSKDNEVLTKLGFTVI